MALARGRHLRPRVAQRSTTRILPHNQRPARLAGSKAERMMAGCRRLRVDYDRDSERFSAFAMLACEPRAVRGTATTPRGGPMDDRGAGRAAVRFGNADQERAEPGPGIAGAALRAAGGVVGRRSCRRDDVIGSESGRLVSLSCHHHDGWAHTWGIHHRTAAGQSRRPVDDKRQQRAGLSGARQLCIFSAPVTACP
jgi:hypothetical protein